MIDFAIKVSTEAYNVGESDIGVLKSHAFTEDDIWDVAAISALFGMSKRLANIASMRPDEEFYAHGR